MQQFQPLQTVRRWLPLVVGSLVLVAALSVWHALRLYEAAQIQHVTAATAAGVGVEVTSRLDARFQALERMAERWAQHGAPSEDAWMYDAALNVRDYAGFQAIEWVDASFVVRWVAPRAGNEAVLNKNLSEEVRRRAALEQARDARTLTITRPVDLMQGGKGFLAYVPIFRGDTFDGFVLGVFRAEAVLGDILDERVAPGYGVAVYDGTELIYQRGTLSDSDAARAQATTVNLSGTTWRVQVWPGAALLAQEQSVLPHVILGGGFVMAVLCAAALHFEHAADNRAKHLKLTNAALNRESAEHKRAEQALRDSEQRFQRLADAAFEAIGISDGTVMLDVNNAFTTIFGYTRAEAIGMPALALVAPQSSEVVHAMRAAGHTDMYEAVLLHKDGTSFPAELRGQTLPYDGRMARVTAVRDISERKRTETRLRNLYNLMAAWQLSLDEKIAQLLNMGRQEFGLDNGVVAHVTGEQYTIMHAVSPNNVIEVGAQFPLHDTYCGDVIQTNGPVALEHAAASSWQQRSCYTLFKLEAYVGAPVSVAGEGYGVLSFSSTKPHSTPFTAADMEFVKLMANWLGGEMKRKQAEEALVNKTREQEAFIYSIAHDLRAPLVSLQGLASMLREDYGDQLDRTATLYVDRISANVEKLHTLMNDLLHLLQVGRVEDELACVDLGAVVQHVLQQLDHTLQARGANVCIDGTLPTVGANRTRMIQVFTNLIDNAVKYTPADRTPLVQIAALDVGNGWEVTVRDNGVGIPPALQAKVFGIFQRLPTGKALNPGGSGVGLAIVSRIVETHGGRLWIDSEEGVGTTFHIVLPKRSARVINPADEREAEVLPQHAEQP